MRFYDIAMFIILINVSILLVGETHIFPNFPTFNSPSAVNVSQVAGNVNNTVVGAMGTDTSSFFAFIFGVIAAINIFIGILSTTLFGVSGLVLWAFNCGTACPANLSYINLFSSIIWWIVTIIYGIAIVQILAGRYVEST